MKVKLCLARQVLCSASAAWTQHTAVIWDNIKVPFFHWNFRATWVSTHLYPENLGHLFHAVFYCIEHNIALKCAVNYTTSCFKFHGNSSPAKSGLLLIGFCPFLAICGYVYSVPILIIHVLYQETTSSWGEIQPVIKLVAGLPGIQEGCVPTRVVAFPPHPSANEAAPLIALEGKP